ncbi:MAG: type II toxin-antitoxin system RelE/ParE family toxin [Spirochaetota bacterium]
MGYEVKILEPAKEFLDTLETKLRAKAFRTIDLLQDFGPFLREPHAKKIREVDHLYELRVKQGNNICRFFYFHHKGKIYIMTSGYVKKDQKLSKKEISRAESLMNAFKEENNE